jgi:hypothetical protein
MDRTAGLDRAGERSTGHQRARLHMRRAHVFATRRVCVSVIVCVYGTARAGGAGAERLHLRRLAGPPAEPGELRQGMRMM